MNMIGKGLRMAVGAAGFATAITVILSIPGVVSDRDSVVDPPSADDQPVSVTAGDAEGCPYAAEGTP
jgi:hypothetical protein